MAGRDKRDYQGAMRRFIWDRDGGVCGYCGIELPHTNEAGGGNYSTIDHIDPDGPDRVDNYLACCKGCNSSKRRKSVEDFRVLVGARARHPEIKLSSEIANWLLEQDWYPYENDHKFYFEGQ